MKSIILDLEFTRVNKENKEEKRISEYEIIQIGAVKLSADNEIEDSFSTYVKPRYSTISSSVEVLTHINNDMVEDAPYFEESMDSFFEWLGEDAIIYSWSESDRDQIINECLLKNYFPEKLDNILDNWVDFQNIYGALLGVRRKLSLENALKSVGIKFKGVQHSAINDAYNTAELFRLTKDEKEFNKRTASIVEFFEETKPLTYTLADKLKGIKIA